jgi:hypothetical protein
VAQQVARAAPETRPAALTAAAVAYARSVDTLAVLYRALVRPAAPPRRVARWALTRVRATQRRDVDLRPLLLQLFGTHVLTVYPSEVRVILHDLGEHSTHAWLYRRAEDRQPLVALLRTLVAYDPRTLGPLVCMVGPC